MRSMCLLRWLVSRWCVPKVYLKLAIEGSYSGGLELPPLLKLLLDLTLVTFFLHISTDSTGR